MTYQVHLWQVDKDGRWLQYAVAKKPDGNMTIEHDTRTHNPPMSFSNLVVGFGMPTHESALQAIMIFNGIIRGHLPDSNVRDETAKKIAKASFNIDHAISLINPTPPIASDNIAEGIGQCFISGLLSYPRFILPSGRIVIGGIDYLNSWADNSPPPTHKAFTIPEELLADERRQRGGFDETVCKFRDVVRWIGEITHTSKSAQLAIMKIDALVQAFCTTDLDTLATLDNAANDVESALQILCADLAEANTALKASPSDGNSHSPKRGPRNPTRTLTQKEVANNKLKNELITEIRRRAKTLGEEGIRNAYKEIEREAKEAGSKWRTIIGLATESAITDKARHNKKYVVTTSHKSA